MLLLTNGCSWTDPDTFKNTDPTLKSDSERNENSWPFWLGSLLNADNVVNMAQGCGSNQRILRTTYDYVSSQDSDLANKKVAVIQWTEPSRYEYYVPKQKESKNFISKTHRWARVKAGVLLSPEKNNRRAYTLSQRRLTTFTETEGMYTMLNYFLSMQKLCDIHNISCFFWQMDPQIHRYPAEISNFIKDNFTVLDFDHDWIYDRVGKNDRHPSAVGHRQIAEIIYGRIKEKVL